MQIAIIHYHLRKGGVTRVIEHSVRLLQEAGHQVVVLASGEVPAGFPGPVARVEELGYDEDRNPQDQGRLESALVTAAAGCLGTEPDLWHFHNHHLGKNLALPQVVAGMAEKGKHLLLQVHDFPEDCRSYNYSRLRLHLPPERFDLCLYPMASHVHYAVLNGRDRDFLSRAGVPAHRLHWLPNPVSLPEVVGEIPEWPWRLWLYPTRAIRRKNLGELLFWATVARGDDHFATSLAPENPREQAIYRAWVQLAGELNLPLSFDLATQSGVSFPVLLQSAHCLVTTSIAEGFGMAFLEPWLVGRPVAGRDLPEITTDFTGAGIDLSALYPRLEIPVGWIGEDRLRAKIKEGLEALYTHYGLPVPEANDLQRAWEAWVKDGQVDFGRLDEPLQTQVIRHLASSPVAREEVPPGLQVPSAEAVSLNRARVAEVFEASRYGRLLEALYQTLLASPSGPVESLDSTQMLLGFLQPERLHLLRL